MLSGRDGLFAGDMVIPPPPGGTGRVDLRRAIMDGWGKGREFGFDAGCSPWSCEYASWGGEGV